MQTNPRRKLLIVGGVLVLLSIGGFAAFQAGIGALKGQVEKALGPNGEVKEIRVRLTGVEITGVRIRAPKGATKQADWPADDELRAERILITPSILDLLSARVVLQGIRVEGAYISMLRAKNGQMKVLPSLLDNPANKTKPGASDIQGADLSTPPISVGKIELVNGTVEFFDATIRQPPLKLRLEQINTTIGKLQLPDLTGQTSIKLEGILKGVRRDGQISIDGSIELATKESGISTRLRGVDLVALQPYLIKATESGVKKGSLDLELNSSIKKGLLRAPGTLTLSDLELASSSTSGTIMGMPRNAAIGMMKDRKGKISVRFVLEGDINDPQFSLNENLTTRIGSSIANVLGVSIEGLTKGVGSVGGDAAKGIADSLGKLFRK